MRQNIIRRVLAVVWTVLRIWMGLKWIDAGYSKITSGFDAGGFLQGAIANARGEHPTVQGWYASFLEGFALPNIDFFNILIPWGELLVGLGLILGLATIPALVGSAFMNANFMLAGIGFNGLDSQLFMIAITLLLIGKGRSFYGLDRLVLPYIKKYFSTKRRMLEN